MKSNSSWQLCLLSLLLFLSSCGTSQQLGNRYVSLETPIKQGLPLYFKYAFYRHLNEMASDAKMIAEGEPGQPVALLDHQFQENVYDSKQAKGVGVLLVGYLKMEIPGKYRFKAMANDGIQVLVNGHVVAFDPAVHSDRFSEVGEVTIADGGWYPISVKYFQRKGTGRLTLYWQTPVSGDFVVVPAEVYGHL